MSESEQQIRLSRFFFYNHIIIHAFSESLWRYPTMAKDTLAPYFKYYDAMVSDWLSNTHYLREQYLPEPWWGWSDSGKPLYAVIINLNPGAAGILQTRKYIRFGIDTQFSYREAMADGSLARHLEGAADWHRNKRETPVLKAIGLIAQNSEDTGTMSHHTLCIESYPFHSKSFDENNAKKYLEYDNGANFWRMIEFASAASRVIDDISPLKNVVLIRISAERWKRIAKNLPVDSLEVITVNEEGKSNPCACAVECKFPGRKDFSEVKFYCIWNPSGRNNFPSKLSSLLRKIGIEQKITINKPL